MNTGELKENEVAQYYKNYVNIVGELTLQEALTASEAELLAVMGELNEEQFNYRYNADKWTIKEILQHLIDTERVFNYRALRYARKDKTELDGFDHEVYNTTAVAARRTKDELLEEFQAQRKSTILFFKSLSTEMLMELGTANTAQLSVRAIGFIQSGHVMHHLNVIKERYLNNF